MSKSPRKNGPRTADGRFASGNAGKPRGARHRATRAIETLLEGEADALTRRAITSALAGDGMALRLCLDRIAPAKRERAVQFDLPKIHAAADVPVALTAILKAVAAGDLTPGEGNAIAGLLDRYLKAYEMTEVESRIADLEQQAEQGRHR